MVAYLFSDIILIARQQGGRENRLLVAMDPVNLCDVIDVEYGSNANGKSYRTQAIWVEWNLCYSGYNHLHEVEACEETALVKGRSKECPTMHHFGIPRLTNSIVKEHYFELTHQSLGLLSKITMLECCYYTIWDVLFLVGCFISIVAKFYSRQKSVLFRW